MRQFLLAFFLSLISGWLATTPTSDVEDAQAAAAQLVPARFFPQKVFLVQGLVFFVFFWDVSRNMLSIGEGPFGTPYSYLVASLYSTYMHMLGVKAVLLTVHAHKVQE